MVGMVTMVSMVSMVHYVNLVGILNLLNIPYTILWGRGDTPTLISYKILHNEIFQYTKKYY